MSCSCVDVAGCPDYSIAGCPDYSIAGCPDYSIAGCPDYSIAGCPDYSISSFDHFSLPPEAMDIDHDQPATLDLPSNQVTVLKGHESEVFTCAWSPSADIIVSG